MIKYKKIWQYYFLSKLLYMFFALFIYSKLTSLGDTWDYFSGAHFHINDFLYNSSSMMGVSGFIIGNILGNILGNIPYMFLSFYGLYYAISRLDLNKKNLIYILLILSLPSFGVWTSICSKESIGVFFMGILSGYMIDLYYAKRTKIHLIEWLAIYLGVIFKPQIVVVILSLILLLYIKRKFNFKIFGTFFLILIYYSSVIIIFNLFYDEINTVALIIPHHFNQYAQSTRENTLLLEYGDIIYNAPYGMFIAFWGPTFNEIIAKPSQSLAFLESSIIIGLFIYFIFYILIKSFKNMKINMFLLFLFFSSIGLILFVHFPFGFMNPGSALRYRENFYSFFVILVFLVKQTYLIKELKGKYICKE